MNIGQLLEVLCTAAQFAQNQLSQTIKKFLGFWPVAGAQNVFRK